MLSGELRTLVLESALLEGNPLGDPWLRELPVYLPPHGRDVPLIAVLAGYGSVGASALVGTPWEPSFPARYEQLLAEGKAAPAAFVFPDAFTRFGGSQYLNSVTTGRYQDHLVDEVFPFVEQECGVGGRRERRGLMGRSSGGFGALRAALDRPDRFAALASHAGDAYFELGYKPDFGRLLEMLDRYGSLAAFVAAFEQAQHKSTPMFLAMGVLAMASVYSPDLSQPLGVALPFDPHTGRLDEAVWARWLEHDPVTRAQRDGARLADYRLVYLDAGRQDEYHLQFGARQVAAALRAHGVRVVHEEFDGGHRGTSHRYEVSLPLITRALA